MPFILGVDIGGTFTDAAAIDLVDGSVYTAKARTTDENLVTGVMDALTILAAETERSLGTLLHDTVKLVHGTTQTSNVMFTWNGARTGLLTTRGFGDEILIMRARGRVAGMGLAERRHFRATSKPPAIVPRDLIEEVAERVDHRGRAIVPLTDAEARRAVDALLRKNVESIAISLLWSPANPRHEISLKRIIAERAPDLYVSSSHRLAPVVGEYERTATAVVDAYVGPTVHAYLKDLSGRLKSQGLTRPLLILQANGGATYAEEAVPVNTIESGPAAGMVAARMLSEASGYRNVIATDVGGTTFKVGLLVDGRWSMAPETVINQYSLLIPAIDLVSIGAGGGSVAWVDGPRLRVGPASAGADPGPAAYGRGGTQPTVTDADVVLGLLDPDRFLGGRMKLRAELATKAIRDGIAVPLFGGDVVQAAAGIRRVVDSQMADLVRKMTMERGHAPRAFVLMSYGGAGPLHAVAYAREVGVTKVIVPLSATVYSAFGAAASDIHHTLQRSTRSGDVDDLEEIISAYASIEGEARELLQRQDVPAASMHLSRWADIRYDRQLHDVRVPVSSTPIDAGFAQRLRGVFEERYTALYGMQSILPNGRLRVLRLGVEATGLITKPAFPTFDTDPPESGKQSERQSRNIYWPEVGKWVSSRVWDGLLLKPGSRLVGPAVIELPGTTVALPPDVEAEIDSRKTTVITLTQPAGSEP
jgi:N-methylhydantoinase A